MFHELQDLDGNIVCRARSDGEDKSLTITDTTAERTITITGLDALAALRQMLEEAIADGEEDESDTTAD